MSQKYRLRVFLPFVMVFLHIVLVPFNSCKKGTENLPAPSIEFISENGYVFQDTTLLLGDFIKLGIHAQSNGTDEITHFHYSVLTDSILTSVDTGVHNETFHYVMNIQKGIAYEEIWSFVVRDRYGRESETLNVKLTKDSASIFGNILHIPSLILGAQNNTTIGGFFSFENQMVYNQNEAFYNQNLIDILYFYDYTGDENTISSPNGNIDAFPAQSVGDTIGLLNWGIRNVTRYEQNINVTIPEFDTCNNDSLILQNTFIFPTGKRKAKNLKAGDICAFTLHDEITRGLFKVLNVNGTNEGAIEVEIKIQKL